MGLASVLQTALTGISAAQTAIKVVGNNLANANTDGFKQQSTRFSTQSPHTQSSGAAPGQSSGGTNPAQTGSGVQTAAISTDFSQGSIALGGGPTQLALQGNGFFIVKTEGGEQLFTRDGNFSLNAEKQLVTSSGQRVQGFQVDGNFEIDDTQLVSLTVPLGKKVAGEGGQAESLIGYSVETDGKITGKFSDGTTRTLGQIQVAQFANPAGLEARGGNTYAAGANSGLPVLSDPSSGSAASITAGGRELSNTDIGRNLVDLVLAGTQFRASVVVLNTADELFEEMANLRR